jgi:hypothetical protein
MRKYMAALACLFIGCAAGSAMPTITAQTFGANPSAPRWEQFCDFEGYPGISREGQRNEYNELLAARGREGWEFVGAMGPASSSPCFRRPAPTN